MITREQVADLQPGDVVGVVERHWPESSKLVGPLWLDADGDLRCGNAILRFAGGAASNAPDRTFSVVSRAPRPLYVNHPRTEPVAGDVASYPSLFNGPDHVFAYTGIEKHAGSRSHGAMTAWIGVRLGGPDTGPLGHFGRLRLLVNGETGQVVQ